MSLSKKRKSLQKIKLVKLIRACSNYKLTLRSRLADKFKERDAQLLEEAVKPLIKQNGQLEKAYKNIRAEYSSLELTLNAIIASLESDLQQRDEKIKELEKKPAPPIPDESVHTSDVIQDKNDKNENTGNMEFGKLIEIMKIYEKRVKIPTGNTAG